MVAEVRRCTGTRRGAARCREGTEAESHNRAGMVHGEPGMCMFCAQLMSHGLVVDDASQRFILPVESIVDSHVAARGHNHVAPMARLFLVHECVLCPVVEDGPLGAADRCAAAASASVTGVSIMPNRPGGS